MKSGKSTSVSPLAAFVAKLDRSDPASTYVGVISTETEVSQWASVPVSFLPGCAPYVRVVRLFRVPWRCGCMCADIRRRDEVFCADVHRVGPAGLYR